jgi:Rps23 Pro-64 3,4-dihydroxylase Tpa1-like proline 4-hydroxylase
MERPEFLPAQFVVLDEFLVPEELNSIMEYTQSREGDFQLSEVIAPGQTGSTLDYEHRRSRVLMDIGEHQAVVLNRIQAYLPRVLQKMGREVFPVTRVEAQITASNDGDFFRNHNDNGQDEIASRELTFVYFFHREPKAFRGGELRIYDSRWENGEYVSTGNYQTIVPEQNQVVFFPSSLLHEITPVECSSRAFADSRFTVNGWFHR